MPYCAVMVSLVLLCAACAGPVAEPPTLASLDETQWLLRAWDRDDPAPSEPLITLTYTEGRFAGRSGCNSYSGAVEAGAEPDSIIVSPIVGTRMACPEMQMDMESRYLASLQAAASIGSLDGNLVLNYQDKAGQQRTLTFSPREDTQP